MAILRAFEEWHRGWTEFREIDYNVVRGASDRSYWDVRTKPEYSTTEKRVFHGYRRPLCTGVGWTGAAGGATWCGDSMRDALKAFMAGKPLVSGSPACSPESHVRSFPESNWR